MAGWQTGLLVLRADCLAACACAACKHSCKQLASRSCQKFMLCERVPGLFGLAAIAVSSVINQTLMACMMHDQAIFNQLNTRYKMINASPCNAVTSPVCQLLIHS